MVNRSEVIPDDRLLSTQKEGDTNVILDIVAFLQKKGRCSVLIQKFNFTGIFSKKGKSKC